MRRTVGPWQQWYRERVLWWRCFLPVVFAHKPLCNNYHSHTLSLGDVRVCRSCLILYSSVALTSGVFMMFPDLAKSNSTWIVPIIFMTVITSYPKIYASFSRAGQDILRFVLGISLGSVAWLLIHRQFRLAVPIIGILWVTKIIFNRIRIRAKDYICEQCPEYHTKKICSGYQYKRQRMRLYEKVLTHRIL